MKKGFTLIELLTIIIVISILATFAVPVVIDVINDSKESANMTSVNILLDSADSYYSLAMMDTNRKKKLIDESNIFYEVEVANKPKTGELYTNLKGDVAIAVVIDNKCYRKYYNEHEAKKIDTDDCTLKELVHDETPPVITQSTNASKNELEWYREDIYVNIEVTDDTSVKGYRRCISDNNCEPNDDIYNANVILVQNTSFVCVIGVDSKNNMSEKNCVEYRIDKELPVITQINIANNWYNDNINVNVSITDNISGVKGYRKCVSDSICEPDNQILDVTNQILVQDTSYVCVIGIDNADNVGEKNCVEYKFDRTIPTIAQSTTSTKSEADWYHEDININVTASDSESGIKGYKKCVSNNICNPSNEILNITDPILVQDTNYVCIIGVDNTNNESLKNCERYKIDKTEPSASIVLDNISKGSIKVNVTASDLESGISKYEYSVDNGTTWQSGTSEYTYSGLADTNIMVLAKITNNADLIKIVGEEIEIMPTNVINIASKDDFINLMGKDLTGYYMFSNDIDLWGTTWTPINNFKGTIDGNGKILKNLNGNNGGLINNGTGTVKNIVVENSTITGSSNTGLIVNNATGNLVFDNINIRGGSINTNGTNVGSFVGSSNYETTIKDCKTSASVTGDINVGGFAGSAKATLINSHVTGEVRASKYAGGLVGNFQGEIINCYATGNVTGTSLYVGGLVGNMKGNIKNSYATGYVVGTDYVGGLVGIIESLDSNTVIENSYATGNVTGSKYIGGLVGSAKGNIIHSHSEGQVNSSNMYVGGLVGIFEGYISKSYSLGPVFTYYSGQDTYVGGLVGSAINSTISDCYERGNITAGGPNAKYAGALIGYIKDSSLTNAYSTGEIQNRATADYFLGYVANTNYSNLYFDPNTSKCNHSDYASTNGYNGFDFNTIWNSGTYPTLK